MAGKKKLDILEEAEEVLEGKETLDVPELYGVIETKDVLLFLAELASASVSWQFTNPMTFATRFERIFPAAVQAFDGIDKVPVEIDDLSEDEIDQLAYAVERTLDFSKLNIVPPDPNAKPVAPAPMGIEDTEDIVRLIAVLAAMGIEAKKLNIGQITMKGVALAPVIFKALAGIGNVPKEFKDLDAAETKRLHAILVQEFHVENVDLEIAVESAWRCVLSWANAVMMLLKIRTSEVKPKAMKEFSRELIRSLGHLAILVRGMRPLFQPPQSPKVGTDE